MEKVLAAEEASVVMEGEWNSPLELEDVDLSPVVFGRLGAFAGLGALGSSFMRGLGPLTPATISGAPYIDGGERGLRRPPLLPDRIEPIVDIAQERMGRWWCESNSRL